MKRHLNTLFVTTDGSHLAKEGQTIVVRRDGKKVLQVPALALQGIVCTGTASVTTALLSLCAANGVSLSFLSPQGRFLARVEGPASGNVLLRKDQFRAAISSTASLEIARGFVLGKIINERTVILRAIRDHGDAGCRLEDAAAVLGRCARAAERANSLDQLRGVEGEAARAYFGVFAGLITRDDAESWFQQRTRRPPLDAANAMLSFAYAVLAHDVRSACEGVGLDPQVGFLHRVRPGRPALALDLMEELRAPIADRAVLTVINRGQVSRNDFESLPGGGVRMRDSARKALLVTYQKRKQDEVLHPFIGERSTIGLVPHLQARLLARHLRGGLDGYPPYFFK
jgi:CRISPR-associated protein Cas1